MTKTEISRRTMLGGAFGAFMTLGLAACNNSSSTVAFTSAAAASTTTAPATVPTLSELKSVVAASFTQDSYTDPDTGKVLPYNVFLPAGYSTATKYPLVHCIADSRLVGQDVTAPLSQYGALIWASAADQAKNPTIVVTPEYPEIIIDDHDSFTTTDYVELTARFIGYLRTKYSVDTNRVYGTGQSMGCMTTMHLAAEHPDLFAAQLLVSGQWDITTLQNLTKEKFFYIAAAGDDKASVGQTDVEGLLTKAGVQFKTATWDATWDSAKLADAATQLLSDGYTANFATFATGTVLTANPSAGNMEHMASFEPAYAITELREWLLAQ